MPWWFWIVLWTVLVLTSVVILGWLSWRVIRQGAQAFDEFLVLNDRLATVVDKSPHSATADQPQRPAPGVVTPISQAYAEYEEGKESRRRARISRRIQKRDSLGQPQRMGDLSYNARKGAHHG